MGETDACGFFFCRSLWRRQRFRDSGSQPEVAVRAPGVREVVLCTMDVLHRYEVTGRLLAGPVQRSRAVFTKMGDFAMQLRRPPHSLYVARACSNTLVRPRIHPDSRAAITPYLRTAARPHSCTCSMCTMFTVGGGDVGACSSLRGLVDDRRLSPSGTLRC